MKTCPRIFHPLLALMLGSTPATALSTLPEGFAGVEVGNPWIDVMTQHDYQDLSPPVTEWDRWVEECGFRSVRMQAEKGELLVTVNDFVVTELSYTTPIKHDSDLFAVADLVMQSYGQPNSASMRNALGQITIDRDSVNYITLEYAGTHGVTFSISGRELWHYQIQVRLERYKWHENQTLRCARAKEAGANEQATLDEQPVELEPSPAPAKD